MSDAANDPNNTTPSPDAALAAEATGGTEAVPQRRDEFFDVFGRPIDLIDDAVVFALLLLPVLFVIVAGVLSFIGGLLTFVIICGAYTGVGVISGYILSGVVTKTDGDHSGGAVFGGFIGFVAGAGESFGRGSGAANAVFGFAPALIFFVIVVVYFSARIYEHLGRRAIAYPLGGLPQPIAWVPLSVLVLICLMMIGPGFILATVGMASWFGLLTELAPAAQAQQDVALGRLGDEMSGVFSAFSQLSFGEIALSLAIIVGVLWILFLYFGLNYLVTRSLRESVHVFILAFFLSLAYLLVSYALAAIFPQTIEGFLAWVSEYNEAVREAFLSSLRSIAWVFGVESFALENLEALALGVSRIVGAIFEMSARMAMLSEEMQASLAEIVAFKERFEATYLFFLLASAMMWRHSLQRQAAEKNAAADAASPTSGAGSAPGAA